MSTHSSARARQNLRRGILLLQVLLLVTSSAILLSVSASSAASTSATTGGFGPLPTGLPIESRCQDMTINTHIVFVGQFVKATANGGICGVTGKDNSWVWGVPSGGYLDQKGCQHDGTYCEFKVTQSTFPDLASLCIIGGNVQGAWTSCDYYGVVGDDMGVIDGHVLNADGSPVPGVTINAHGPASVSAVSASDGFYGLVIKKGTYHVVPSGGTPPGPYVPASALASVVAGQTTHLDFKLDSGIKLTLKFSKSSAVANGYDVVKVQITTKQYGKPAPGVTVQLDVKPTEPSYEAVTTGARATICVGGSTKWPTLPLNTPDGAASTVTTGPLGTLDFTINIGTTPGVWTLDAWAYNANGVLSTDFLEASSTKSVTFTKNGSNQLSDFEGELANSAKDTTFSTQLANAAGSANTMWTLLSQDAAQHPQLHKFGGLVYSLVNAKDGQSMLIFPENDPPKIDRSGEIVFNPKSRDDLVYDPAEWTGKGLPGNFANIGSLSYVLSHGIQIKLPTLAQFYRGQTVLGWNAIKGNALTLFSTSYEYLGWGYPVSAPGACY